MLIQDREAEEVRVKNIRGRASQNQFSVHEVQFIGHLWFFYVLPSSISNSSIYTSTGTNIILESAPVAASVFSIPKINDLGS